MQKTSARVPICKTLAGIHPPRDARAYQVADLDSRKPAWSPPRAVGDIAEPARLPARVRFLDSQRRCRWGFVRVDPEHPEAQERVGVLLLKDYRRALWAEQKRRGRGGQGGSLAKRVAALEAEVAALRAQREREET